MTTDCPLFNLRIVPILGRSNDVVTLYSVVADVDVGTDMRTVVVASGVTERIAKLIVEGYLAGIRAELFGDAKKTIVIDDSHGTFAVWQGDHGATDLTWDEMLGQIATMTHPDIKQPKYRMRSAAQIAGEKRS